jgi:prephenate dehydratase
LSTYAFLGPQGTFTEEALLSLEIPDVEPVSRPTIWDVFEAVEQGDAKSGIVPIENSIEGSVTATLDMLAFESDLMIRGEVVRDIHHALIVSPGLNVEQITAVASHPQASAQCRKWLARVLPGRPIEAANSTSEAVGRAVAEPGVAAIGTELAAELHGGEILFSAIEDHASNKTRFVLIGREDREPSGRDKTSLACFIMQDQPGALLQILQEFAYRYLNLTKIQSRPTKERLGDYMFFIDVEGHRADDNLAGAIKCLQCKVAEVKVLGSYPAAD